VSQAPKSVAAPSASGTAAARTAGRASTRPAGAAAGVDSVPEKLAWPAPVRLPDFVIIGAMKSATTTLHAQLARQPGIVMSDPKEPNFFSDDEQWARGLEWYASLFAGAGPDDLAGESSTHYTKLPTHPRAVERMREHLGPDVKLVYVMRQPIERLLSQYVHEVSQRKMPPIDRAVDEVPGLVDYGRYSLQLEPYLRTFGPGNVLPVFFDRLSQHPQAELERVARFLGYRREPRWDASFSERNVSTRRLRFNPVRDAVVRAPGLATLRRRVVPAGVQERAKRRWAIEAPRPSPATLERLREVYDADLARLGEWLGVELTCDDFKTATVELVPSWQPGVHTFPA
jgi:sulfotransferase family protein